MSELVKEQENCCEITRLFFCQFFHSLPRSFFRYLSLTCPFSRYSRSLILLISRYFSHSLTHSLTHSFFGTLSLDTSFVLSTLLLFIHSPVFRSLILHFFFFFFIARTHALTHSLSLSLLLINVRFYLHFLIGLIGMSKMFVRFYYSGLRPQHRRRMIGNGFRSVLSETSHRSFEHAHKRRATYSDATAGVYSKTQSRDKWATAIGWQRTLSGA